MNTEKCSGWIKLHRKLINWQHHNNPILFMVFGHLLLLAEFEDREIDGYAIPKGSVVISTNEFAKFLNIDRSTLRRALKDLEEDGCINVKTTATIQTTKQTTNKKTIHSPILRTLVTICNYNSYQALNSSRDQTNDHSSDQSRDHSNDQYYKEYIKEEYKEISSSPARAHTREEEEILKFDELAEKVKNECPIWIEQMAYKLQVSESEVCRMIDNEFRKHCLTDAHSPHMDMRDFQSHFNRWANKQKYQSKQNATTTTTGGLTAEQFQQHIAEQLSRPYQEPDVSGNY